MLSVVIPSLNEGPALGELVAQLQSEEGVGEIIVVEGGEAGSLDTASLFNLRLLRAEKVGRAVQMNQGAAAASLPAICFVHADNRPPTGFAGMVQQALKEAKWGRFDIRIDHALLRFRLIEAMINLRSRFTRLATGDQGIFVDRKWFEQQGRFLELPLMEDVEFSKRVGRAAPPALIRQPMRTSARRWLHGGTVRTIFLMWKIRFLYWRGTDPAKLAKMYRHAR